MADWDLSKCCGSEEIIFLSLWGGFFVIFLLLWKTVLLKPLKLIGVFFHEMSHATACWLTGGQVNAIEIHADEGGVTKYQGGWRCCIIPAGYCGGAFFGGLFVFLSGNRYAATVAAGIIVVALLISLCYKPNAMMCAVSIGFTCLTLLFVFLEWFVFNPLLEYLTLFYGVFIGMFSVYDIYDDLITRTVEGSDAHACHQV
jgi:hypothetical protein